MATIFSAPILPTLTYANTFVDWFTTTNTMVVDFNNFTANSYAKNTGTLYLNEPTTALVANGAVQLNYELAVTGGSSYVVVDNDLTINYGQLIVSNANSSIIAAGVVQVGNTVYANGANTGLFVSNNATLNANSYFTGNAYFNKQIFVTGTATLNTLTVLGNTNIQNTVTITGTTNVLNTFTATGNVNGLYLNAVDGVNATLAAISGAANVGRLYTTLTGQIGTQLLVGDSITTANANYANTLQANNVLYSNVAYANTLQANVSTNTATANAIVGNIVTVNSSVVQSNTIYANVVTSNTRIVANVINSNVINSAVINVNSISSNTQFANVSTIVLANVTNTLNVNTGIVYVNTAFANTITSGNVVVTTANIVNANITNSNINNSTVNNESVNVATISLANVTNTLNVNTGIAYFNTEYSNTSYIQNVNSVNQNANIITANTYIYTPSLNVNTTLTANLANSYLGNVYAGNLTLSGNLFLSFPLITTSNSLTLYATEPTAPQFAQFAINRGTGANSAQLQWYENNKQWQINDVVTNSFYPILTGEVTNNSIILNSTSNIATSNAVYTANLYTQSAFNFANAVNVNTTSAFAFANSVNAYAYAAYASQNTTANFANGAFAFANSVNNYSYSSYASQNTTANFANGAFAFANSVNAYAYAAYASQNITASFANGAFAFANTVNVYSYASYAQSNNAFANASLAFARANTMSNTFVGTTGTANPVSSSITFVSGNGVTVVASANQLTVATPQDIRITASPTFNALTLTNPLSIGQGGTGQITAPTATAALIGPASGVTYPTGAFLLSYGPGQYAWFANTSANISYTTSTGTDSTKVTAQLAIQDLYSIKANLASPAFTGVPTSVTMSQGVAGNTMVATTAYVTSLANSGTTFAHNITGSASLANNLFQVGFSSSGGVHYQSAAGTTSFTATGSSSQVLIGGSSPSWSGTPAINITGSAGTAGALSGLPGGAIPIGVSGQISSYIGISGTVGDILAVTSSGVVGWEHQGSVAAGTAGALALGSGIGSSPAVVTQTGPSTTSYVTTSGVGAGSYLQYNGSGIVWASAPSTATNLAPNGTNATGAILFQSGTSTTYGLSSSGAAGYYLQMNGGATAPQWTNSFSGASVSASGTISAGAFSTGGTVSASGTISAGAFSTGGTVSASSTISAGAFTTGGSISATGTISAGAFSTGGTVSASGTISAGAFSTGGSITASGAISAGGNITAYSSDARLKGNVVPIVDALGKIDQIGGYTFDWLMDICNSKGFKPENLSEHGVLAQEIQKVMPDAVVPAPFNNEYLTVRYEKIVPLLIQAIKELKVEVEALKKSK